MNRYRLLISYDGSNYYVYQEAVNIHIAINQVLEKEEINLENIIAIEVLKG